MLRAIIKAGLLLALGLLPAFAAATTMGQADQICLYSHTLPDDAILFPSQPGSAMQHDFFGNIGANGYTTGATLLAQPASTCDNIADATAYWLPSLRLADGTIIRPTYQKTYYNNEAVRSSNYYKVNPYPAGLQMLAGNHAGTGPNPDISFLCTGSRSGYTSSIPTDCVPDPVNGTQFNIGVSFPVCWDGINLAPAVRMGGHNNMAYAAADGACPKGYPVRIPHASMNVAYMLGQVRDLRGIQLSLDPTLNAKGEVTRLNWGSLYTSHGDFFNGWQTQSAQFMVDYCINKGLGCETHIAYSYAEPVADATVIESEPQRNTGSVPSLLVRDTSADVKSAIPYLKFDIPSGLDKFTKDFTPYFRVMIYGGNASDTSADMLYVYEVNTSWNELDINSENAPLCEGAYVGRLYLDNERKYRDIDVTAAVVTAIQAGKKQIAFCIRGGGATKAFTFDSKEGENKPVLYLIGDHPYPY